MSNNFEFIIDSWLNWSETFLDLALNLIIRFNNFAVDGI